MRRAVRIGIVVVIVLAGLLVVNALILDKQTKSAEVNAPGGKLIDLSTVELQYVDSPATGSGPEGEPIVLLHCFTCSLRWWDDLVPLINESHRVIAFDLVGHGGSEKPSSGYEIESQSAAIAEALNELGVSSATVVGHSMGGLVATSLAEQSSDVVDRVVLVDVPAKSGQVDLPATASAGTIPVIGEAIWRIKLNAMVKSAAESSFAPGTDVSDVFDDPDRVVDDVNAMTFRSYKSSKEASEDFLDDGSIVSRLMSTGVPVMAIMGTEDQILDTDEVLGEYEAIPGVRIVPIEDAGHSPNVEQPQEVADQISSFVGSAPLVPPPSEGAGGNGNGPPGGDEGPGNGGGKQDQGGNRDQGGKNGNGGKKKGDGNKGGDRAG